MNHRRRHTAAPIKPRRSSSKSCLSKVHQLHKLFKGMRVRLKEDPSQSRLRMRPRLSLPCYPCSEQCCRCVLAVSSSQSEIIHTHGWNSLEIARATAGLYQKVPCSSVALAGASMTAPSSTYLGTSIQ